MVWAKCVMFHLCPPVLSVGWKQRAVWYPPSCWADVLPWRCDVSPVLLLVLYMTTRRLHVKLLLLLVMFPS